MKASKIAAVFAAAALAFALVACAGTSEPASGGETAGNGSEAVVSNDTDFSFFEGQWRGSVKTTGQTVYGNAGGSEQMLDIIFDNAGGVSVEPLEAHADLLTDTGTYEGDETEVTLHLSDRDITLTVINQSNMEGNAADFDIDGFDTINFYYYG